MWWLREKTLSLLLWLITKTEKCKSRVLAYKLVTMAKSYEPRPDDIFTGDRMYIVILDYINEVRQKYIGPFESGSACRECIMKNYKDYVTMTIIKVDKPIRD